jgi:hypothetical protein
MGLGDIGLPKARAGGKFARQLFVGGEIVQHARQESRLARRGANLGRTDAGDGQEPPQPLGIGGNEASRVIETRLFIGGYLPFRNKSALPLHDHA